MTPELYDDLTNFSFDNLWDVDKRMSHESPRPNIHNFPPAIFECLKMLVCYHIYSFGLCPMPIYSMMQPSTEADRISRTLQADFDKILCNVLEKYHSFPGFALVLGGLLQSIMNIKERYAYPPGMIAYLHLVRRRGEGHILDDIGFSGILAINRAIAGTRTFLTYFAEFLENPERSGTHVFDQQRYTTAAKECLQLCLCSSLIFSKGAMESGHRDRALRRSKPSAWISRMGVRSRIRKSRHHLEVRQCQSLVIDGYSPFPDNSPEHEYCQSLSYQWGLDILPFLLEKSAISLELAKLLHGCSFAKIAWEFPRKVKLAKKAIARYLLRAESVVGDS